MSGRLMLQGYRSSIKATVFAARNLRPLQASRKLSSILPKVGSEKSQSSRKILIKGGLVIGIAVAATTATIWSQSLASPISNDDERKVTPEELAKHNSGTDCWVAINGKVYDLTEFLPQHPGGRNVILKRAGKDASKVFNPIHPPDAISKFLPADKFVGVLDGELPEEEEVLTDAEIERQERIANKPPLSSMFNVYDFEYVAQNILDEAAWAYYSSAADDEITLRENHFAYHKVFFRPRILVDVTNIELETEMLGIKTSAPFYISATALAKLGHPEGEVGIAKGAGRGDIIQMISTLASCSLDETVAAAKEGQSQWFQLYVNSDREVAYNMIKHCEELGIKGIFVTVDAPSLGNREKDRRMKFTEDTDVDLSGDGKTEVNRSNGAAAALSSFIDTAVTWKDIQEFKRRTNLPIVIKGVQRTEDVILAAEHGVDGVVLSNHGGRQLDGAPPALQVLAECMPVLRQRGLDKKLEVFVDGGIRRGTDIMKALCLGAKGVGLGRPFLYANSAYGPDGVEKAIDILKNELIMNMRLLGVTKISDLSPEFVDTRPLFGLTANDRLFNNNYLDIEFPKFKDE
ncbi:BA75_03029T0 [Komagataella pastoris]|uniref:L-lactate dehydrogenase (cytochrome) n=1 Tax=Komagataella pastoris TaxID=4922 RepID=A0A1B2JAZ0_PICPA|nr:BA75_03029T0 [Komagataella pastoris]